MTLTAGLRMTGRLSFIALSESGSLAKKNYRVGVLGENMKHRIDRSRLVGRLAAVLLATTCLTPLATGAQAQTIINVTVASDTGTTSAGATGGAGTLSAALAQINASVAPPGGFVINLQTNVTLSGPLSPIFNSVTINGNGNTISGNNSQRIFMVGVDTATQTAPVWLARSSPCARRWPSTMSRCPPAWPRAATAMPPAAWARAARCSSISRRT